MEHGVYNLSRMRESATKRYKVYQIPMNWMLDTGYVSQVKSIFSLLYGHRAGSNFSVYDRSFFRSDMLDKYIIVDSSLDEILVR